MNFPKKMEQLETALDEEIKKLDRHLTRVRLAMRFFCLFMAFTWVVPCIEDYQKHAWLFFDAHILIFLMWFGYALMEFDRWKSVKIKTNSYPVLGPLKMENESVCNLYLGNRVLMLVKLNSFQMAEVQLDAEAAKALGKELVIMGHKISIAQESEP